MKGNLHHTCPSCNQLVNADDRQCPTCHADIALAALIVERAITTAPLFPNTMPTTPEALVPRIGELLSERGLIQKETLQHALSIQEKMTRSGEPMLLGEILVMLGYISRQQLEAIVTQHVLELQAALKRQNQQLEAEVQQRTQQLQISLQKLTELNQIKLNFISNVSHELRTPMQFLMGYLDLFGNGTLGSLSAEQAKAVGSLRNASERLHRLIEDLLQFSSVAGGDIPMDMAALTLDLPVKTAVSLTKPKARAREIALKKRLSDSLPPVVADNQKITWVVEQFLDNAIKFTPSGGQVKVETAPLNGNVFVRVTDTGIGIPDNRMNEIF